MSNAQDNDTATGVNYDTLDTPKIPVSRFVGDYLISFWNHRWLTMTVAKSELRHTVVRYPMRYVWWILEPLLLLLCYVFLVNVLGRGGPREGVPFYVFVAVGILPWYWTVSCLTGSATIITQYSGPITQIKFPTLTVIVARFFHETLLYLISQIVLLALLFFAGFFPNIHWLWWPLLFFAQAIFILSLMFLISATSVYLPDLTKFIPFIVRLWFYGTPILWDIGMSKKFLTPTLQMLLDANPMAFMSISYRKILLFNESIDLIHLSWWLALFVFLFIIFSIYYIFREKSFARFL